MDREKFESLFRALVPGVKPLKAALSACKLNWDKLLDALSDPDLLSGFEEKAENYIRFCYLMACTRLAAKMLEDPDTIKTPALRFLAERFDPKYMPTSQVLHTRNTLPEFAAMGNTELLQAFEDNAPRYLTSALSAAKPLSPTGTVTLIEADGEETLRRQKAEDGPRKAV